MCKVHSCWEVRRGQGVTKLLNCRIVARSDPDRVVKAQTEISDWVGYTVKTATSKVEQMLRVERVI